ncbi:MAG: fibronectin-binding domain-containing protein [Deltaproteobacteria bacterium]|nr:fibronectin-binding domain-containing protein [Deltaproteobacteria bacterium]MCL4873424.1 NFACT family protein [bacterium]
MKNVVSELNERLSGGVVSKIHQPDGRNILLRIFAMGREERLIISAHHRLGRMHITGLEFRNPPSPLRFCAFLRSRITNARIEGISQSGLERIAYIDLSARKGDDEREAFRLVCELTGKSANIILVDGEGVVLDALRYFEPETSARAVMPGFKLSPLPPPEKAFAEEAIPKGEGESWNEAADKFYSSLLREEEFSAKKGALKRVIGEAEKKLRRKLRNLEGDRMRALSEVENYKTGELLTTSFHLLKRGMKEAEVVDYTKDPPGPVLVRLDERLGPAENVERYFKRARKAKKALKLLEERVPVVEEELEYVGSLHYQLEEAETYEDLSEIEDELQKGGYLKRMEKEKIKEAARAEPVRRFKSTDGFEILCGKSGAGNDLLVSEYASNEDIWFHARNMPGSHALIKAGGRAGDITRKTIEEAASIAAFYSKGKNASRVDVIYTEARNVKKPRGAKPGMVMVREFKSVVVRPGLPKGAVDGVNRGEDIPGGGGAS